MAWPTGLVRTNGSDVVNELTALNGNWDLVDVGYSSLYLPSGFTPSVPGTPSWGTEWVSGDGQYEAYTEDGWVSPQSEHWGSWQNVTITSPYFSRTGDPIQLRVSLLGNVEMKGAVQANSDPTIGFPDTGYQLVNSGQFGTGYLPQVTEVFPAGMQPVSSGFSGGQIYLTVSGSPSKLAIYVLPQGTRDPSTNYITFDQVRYMGV